MEENIIAALDGLTQEQTDTLLAENLPLKMRRRDARRIKNAVRKQVDAAKQRRTHITRRLAACAVAVAILFTAASWESVSAAVVQAFRLIPSFGLVTEGESISSVLTEPVTAETDDAILKLHSAFATQTGITVVFTLERKDFDENAPKEAVDVHDRTPQYLLYAGKKRYEQYVGSVGGGGGYERGTQTFTDLRARDIGTDVLYRLEMIKENISVEFRLRDISSYQSLEEIGATDYHNNISVTAVPTFLEGQLQVDLYPVNKSGYELMDVAQMERNDQNPRLLLETNSGTKAYTNGDIPNRFLFDIEPGDKDFTLRIPCLAVRGKEKMQTVTLPIPAEGESETVNQRVKFADCTMTIVAVQRLAPSVDSVSDISEYGALRMTLQYENKASNKIMFRAEMLHRVNGKGEFQSNAYSLEPDENGICTAVRYGLEEGENKTLRLAIGEPMYYLTDEYVLKFAR